MGCISHTHDFQLTFSAGDSKRWWPTLQILHSHDQFAVHSFDFEKRNETHLHMYILIVKFYDPVRDDSIVSSAFDLSDVIVSRLIT